jgi:DNA-binding GntR family transcriptional regulator
VYQFIQSFKEEYGISPTLREIGDACTVSLGTVSEYLSHLEAQGKIKRLPYKSRGIRLTKVNKRSDERAGEVYDYIEDALEDGESPSQVEIAEACFLSRAEVRRALIWLEGQGWIERKEGQRNIRIIERKI